MEKPVKRARKELFNHNDVLRFIEDKHKINVHDFAGHYGVPTYLKDRPPRQDFWDWFMDQNDWITNGCEARLPAKSTCDIVRKAPDWVKEIVALIEQDFGDQADDEGYIDVWIEW